MTPRAAPFEAPASLADTGHVVRAGLFAFPFLCPVVAGPSVNVWQLLATWACVAGLLAMGPVARPARQLWLWLAVVAMAVVLPRNGALAFLWLPTCAVVAGVAVAACPGAGLLRCRESFLSMFASGLLVAGLLSAVLGLLQYYGLAEPLVPWTTSPPLGRAYGNLRQRNQFATLISMAIIAALWLHATRAPASSRTRRALVAAVVLLLIAAAASTSRTGLLQLLSIVAVASFIAHRERRAAPPGAPAPSFSLPSPLALLAMIPLYFAIAWALPHFLGSGVEGMLQRLQTRTADVHGRLVLWHNVLTLIAERPWTGWGWGELSFAHFTTSYSGARFTEILDNAHNLPLHLAVELGIPAAVLICGGFIWMVIAAKPWRERDPTRLMAWGMLGAIVLHSLLEYPLWYGPFQLVVRVVPRNPVARGGRGQSRCPDGHEAKMARNPCVAFVDGRSPAGHRRLRQLGLHPHQPDLPSARRAPACLRRRHAFQTRGLMAFCASGGLRRTHADRRDASQCGEDACTGRTHIAFFARAARHRQADRKRRIAGAG